MPQLQLDLTADQKLELRVGCAGWTIPREFSARFPAAGTHLQRYSHVLNCSEINSSFYRPHKAQTWARWRDSVPGDFLFSVKAPKAITHAAKLACRREDLAGFLAQINGLERKLGPVLFQLPPSFNFDEGMTGKFLSMLRELHAGDVVWEPRHESWFSARADKLLRDFRITRVAADPACVQAAAVPGGYGELCYYRLHGSPRRYYSSYGLEFLEQLRESIEKAGAARAWCIFDNTASGAAAGNAMEVFAVMGRRGSKPKPL